MCSDGQTLNAESGAGESDEGPQSLEHPERFYGVSK